VANVKNCELVAAFRREQMIINWKDKKGVSTIRYNCMDPVQTRKGEVIKADI
jgi:hypothetical protein